MTSPLGVGVLGLGMAGGVMSPIVANHPKFSLRGAADLQPALRERFTTATGLPAYEDRDLLFRRSDIDVVYIATPHQFHREHAIAAMKAGKHVVVEKPIALNLEDSDAMIAVAEQAGRVLIVGHSHGFDPAPRAIGSLVASGRYGALSMMTSLNFTDFIYRPRRPEELDTAKGGGIFFNQLPHQIEMARVIANEAIVSVRCITGIMDPVRPTQGHLAALLMFASGAVASIVYSGHDRFDSDELSFAVGEIGYAKMPAHGKAWRAFGDLKNQEEEIALRRDRYGFGSGITMEASPPPHQPHFGVTIVTCAEADIRPSAKGLLIYGKDGIDEVNLPGAHTFAGQLNVWNDCYAAVVEGKPALHHDGRFARETLSIILAMLESARCQREILLEDFSPIPAERPSTPRIIS